MYDVIALGELLIDFTQNGLSEQGNGLFEANPGGAPCNVLSMLNNLGKKTSFIGKVGNDQFGKTLKKALAQYLHQRFLLYHSEKNLSIFCGIAVCISVFFFCFCLFQSLIRLFVEVFL